MRDKAFILQGQRMNFYKLIKQQYEDYKIEYDALSVSCEGCPCRTLRDEIFGTYEQTGCTDEMAYLVDKYKINDANIYLCDECMVASLKIAKKMTERSNRI